MDNKMELDMTDTCSKFDADVGNKLSDGQSIAE
jgi:hypothetical protein